MSLSRLRILLLFWLLAGLVAARELPSGVAWALELPGPIQAAVAIESNVLVLAGDQLVCVASSDGKIVWRSPNLDSPLLAVQGAVIVSRGSGVVALNLSNGQERWRHAGQNPRLQGGRLWVLEQQIPVALDPATGVELERHPEKVLACEPEGSSLWICTPTQVGFGEVRLPLKDARLLAPGVVQVGPETLWLNARGEVLVRRKLNDPSVFQGRVADRSDALRLYNRQGKLLWQHKVSWPRLSQAAPGLLQVDDLLLELDSGRVVRRGLSPEARVLGKSFYDFPIPKLKVDQTTYPGLFQGYEGETLALRTTQRVVVGARSTLVGLGDGPGTVRFSGASQLSVTAESPQVPPEVRFTVSGRYLNGVNLEVLQGGKVVARKSMPWRVGYSSDSMGVKLKVPGPGVYRVVARGAGHEAGAEVSLTDLALLGKLSPERLYLQVQSLARRKPAAGVSVTVPGLGQGVTDALGQLSFPLPSGQSRPAYQVDARLGAQQLRLTTPGVGPERPLRIYLQTDRPLYRPGHKLFFRGVAMKLGPEGQQVATGEPVAVVIRDPADSKLLDTTLTTDEFGVIQGQLTLPAEVPLGRCTLTAGPDSLPFEVQEFRKPPFQIALRATRPLYVGSEPLTFELDASYFFAGPVKGAQVSWTLSQVELYGEPDPAEGEEDPLATDYRSYRSFVTEGEAVTDEQGKAVIRLSAPERKRDARYFLSVKVVGAEGREVEQTASTLGSVDRYGVYVRPLQWVGSVGQPVALKVRTLDRLGKPHAASGQVEVWRGRKLLERLPFRTGAEGQTTVSFRPRSAGSLRLRAVSQKVEGESWIWISGTASEQDYPALQLVPARTSARPGESLRCLILADRPGTVWLTVEGSRLLDQRVVVMSGKSAVVDLKVTREYAPSVTLRATLPQPQYSLEDSVALRVPLDQNHLEVSLSKDREDFRPAQTAELTLVTREQGQPRRSSVALAVVDEALLALKAEYAGDIHRFFYAQRPNLVQSFEAIPRKPWVAGFQTIEAQAPVRENFQDTAFWQAAVLTGADGTARVSVPLPDNLTSWRATARAVSPPASVGQTSARLLVRLPIMVQAFAPRFWVQGDESDVKLVAHNRTEESQKLALSLETKGAQAVQPAAAESVVAAGGQSELRTRLAVQSSEEVELLSRARAGNEGDAERVRVPVKPFGLPREQYFAGLLDGPRELDYRIPAGARRVRLEVRLDGSPAGVVADTLRYLADYPYGCVEQTMSRFVPTLAASQALQSLNLKSPISETELQAMVTASLEALYGYQHEDGGWGWWKEDRTNPFLTGYVISGLVRARQANWPIREEVLQAGVECARQLLDAASSPEDRAYLAWALALAGHAPLEQLKALELEASLSTYSRALVALGLQQAGQKPDLTALRQLAVREGSLAHWKAASRTAYGWTDDDLEATCLVLQALVHDNAQDPLLSPGVAWVLSQRWKSTKDSAQAVFLLSSYLVATGQTATATGLEVRLDGQSVALTEGRARLEPGPGQHRLELAPSAGLPVVSARLTYYEASELDVLAAEQHGLRVERTYRRPGQRAPLAAAVHPQDELEVELVLEAPQAMEYLMLEDPRAAGMEVPDEAGLPYRREVRDDRTVFFLSSLPAGRTRLVYRQRAETPGRFQALPARASLMYRPEVWGCSQSQVLEILRQ
ncbi:MAG: hypothetical protein AMXMBFR33_33300 [Candidatus Xenobia bacterium]